VTYRFVCEGFNEKNDYDRQTPCDQDYLRKMARDTEARELETWFNRHVVGLFKQHHAFDAEGIFIGDATYLFVPDNPQGCGSPLARTMKHPCSMSWWRALFGTMAGE
jgi:hypothetical protein